MNKLIALSGDKGAGKSEVAKVLTKQGYTILKFADALKDMVCEIVGYTREELEGRKEEPCRIRIGLRELSIIYKHTGFDKEQLRRRLFNRYFNSIRHLLQYLGTDVIRVIDKNWHIQKLSEKLVGDGPYAVDDMRFPNEMKFILWKGGTTLRIERPGTGNDCHESETALDAYVFDHVIVNDSTLEALCEKVERLVGELESA